MKNYRNASLKEVRVSDPVMAPRIAACRDATIPSSLEKCRETGRIDAFKLEWKPGMPNPPHVFWDSDVAKVLEGMAYMLALHPDAALERCYDDIVGLIAAAQQPDGYLNVHFTVVEPEKRWQNLCTEHELYCAGHLMEAAVAGYEMLGKRTFLEVMSRYADYIGTVFGRGEGQKRGYPGHEEIELALVRLAHATGDRKYLDLARYFVDERGQKPNYFEEVEKHVIFGSPAYQQAHIPVREQSDAVGHAVRAAYLYSGMADVARLTGDGTLFAACERLFDSIVQRRMYVTGGIGSSFMGEAFTVDYDLSNGSMMYAESCAAIGLVYFASRMNLMTGDGRYADVVERAIYNGILSGISLSGDKFFYTNYLEVDDNLMPYSAGSKVRQPWFDCSCCPTNFCRFIPQMTEYLWSLGDAEIRLNIPAAGRLSTGLAELEVASRYPYDGAVAVKVVRGGSFTLAIRIPGWCRHHLIRINGETVDHRPEQGYVAIERAWQPGDLVEYTLDMPVEVLRCNLKVTMNAGRIALQRGPLVYCCEGVDNAGQVRDLVIPARQEFRLTGVDGLPEGTVAITGRAWRESAPDDALYHTGEIGRAAVAFTAIPYALWQNRGETNMAVWMRSE